MSSKKSKRIVAVPKRKKTAKKKKTKYTERGMVKKNTRTLIWHKQPWPPTLYTKFSFTQTVFMSGTAGIPDVNIYRLNSPYDPDLTGGGNSCAWFSKLCAADGPYTHHRTISSKIRAMYVPNTTSAQTGQNYLYVGWRRSTVAAPDGYEDAKVSPHYITRLANTVYNKPAYITMACATQSAIGVKDLEDEAGAAALYNSSPTLAVYWDIGIQALDKVSNATGHISVEIEYYVQLYSSEVEPTDD